MAQLQVEEKENFTPPTNLFQVRLVKFNGKPRLDIRRYYKDTNAGGEVKPSPKGIALDHEGFGVLKSVIENHGPEIEAFLSGEGKPDPTSGPKEVGF